MGYRGNQWSSFFCPANFSRFEWMQTWLNNWMCKFLILAVEYFIVQARASGKDF